MKEVSKEVLALEILAKFKSDRSKKTNSNSIQVISHSMKQD